MCPPTQEKVCALQNQAHQLGLQASQECERMAKDRTATLQMLQKVSVFVVLYQLRSLGLSVEPHMNAIALTLLTSTYYCPMYVDDFSNFLSAF